MDNHFDRINIHFGRMNSHLKDLTVDSKKWGEHLDVVLHQVQKQHHHLAVEANVNQGTNIVRVWRTQPQNVNLEIH